MYSKSDSGPDIAALLDRGDLPVESYKTFVSEERVAAPAKTARAAQLEVRPTEIAPVAPPIARPRVDGERATVMEAAAKMLSQFGKDVADDGQAATWNALPSAKATALAGVTGGAGATTLLASAASLLSKEGRRTVLADKGASLLPFYFGGLSFRTASASFIPHRKAGCAPVHLVTGPVDAPSDGWLLQGLYEFRTDVDRILLDCSTATSPEAGDWVWSAAAAVLVLTPEPASLLRLPAVLESSRRRRAGSPAPAILINHYDPSNSLHGDIRATLSQRFGEHLLPFVVRRDPVFSECLAAGGTVTELAPESAAAEDVRQLVDWLLDQGARGGI